MWCVSVLCTFGSLLTSPHHIKDDLPVDRRIALARKRGLGPHPSKIYGTFSPPLLTPSQLRLVGRAFVGCLLAACTPVAPRVFLFAAYILSFLYFSMLFADGTLSGCSYFPRPWVGRVVHTSACPRAPSPRSVSARPQCAANPLLPDDRPAAHLTAAGLPR